METRSRQGSEVQTENQDEEPNGSLREFVPAWVSVPGGLVDFSSYWCWDFHSQPSLELTEHDPEKRKYSSSSSCGGKKCLVDVRGQKRRGRRASLNTQSFKSPKKVSNSSRGPWKHHSEQLGTGKWGSIHTDWPKRWKIVETLAGLKSHDFSCNIQMGRSGFGLNNMKASIQPGINTSH